MLIESEIKTATLGLADFRPIDKKSKKGKKENESCATNGLWQDIIKSVTPFHTMIIH